MIVSRIGSLDRDLEAVRPTVAFFEDTACVVEVGDQTERSAGVSYPVAVSSPGSCCVGPQLCAGR